MANGFKDSLFNKILGLEPVDANGLPTGNPEANVLRKYQDPNTRYRLSIAPGGEEGLPFDERGRDATIYRGPQDDLLTTKYNSQKFWPRKVYATGRLLGSTLAKTGAGIGFLGGLGWEAGRGALATLLGKEATGVDEAESKFGSFISRAADNALSRMFLEFEEDLKEAMPIFQSKAYLEGNAFQKALTGEFWHDDFVDGLAFVASTWLPGTQLAKLGAGAKAAKAFASVMRKANIGKVGPVAGATEGAVAINPKLATLARQMDKATTFSLMTSMEAMFEANEIKKSILNDPKLQKQYSPQELKEVAAMRARDTYLMNLIALAPSNLLEVGTIFNKTSLLKAKKASRTPQGIKLTKEGKYIANEPTTLIGKFMNNPNTKMAGTLAQNMAAEGLYEENIQYTIQKLNEQNAHKGKEFSFMDNFVDLIRNIPSSMTDLSDKERAHSILLGSIIGGGQTVLGNLVGDENPYKEKTRLAKARQSLLDNLNKANQDLTSFDIFEKEADKEVSLSKENGKYYAQYKGQDKKEVTEVEYNNAAEKANIDPETGGEGVIAGGYVIDVDGGPKINVEKLQEYVKNVARNQELEDYLTALSQAPEKNRFALNLVKKEKLLSLAWAHFQSGLGEELQDKLDAIGQMSPEEVSFFGFDPKLDKDTEIREAKQYVQELEELYNSIEQGVVPDSFTDENVKLNKERQKEIFDKGARILAIDKIARTNRLEIDSMMNSLSLLSDDPAVQQQIDEQKLKVNTLSHEIDNLLRIARDGTYTNVSTRLQEANEEYANELEKLESLRERLAPREARTNPLFPQLRRAVIMARELTESRKNLYEEWANIADVLTGAKYFKKNYDKIVNKYKPYPSLTLVLQDDTTLEKYEKYETRQLKIMRMKAKFDQVAQEYFGEVWRSWILQGSNGVDIAEFLIEQAGKLTKADWRIVKALIMEEYEEAMKTKADHEAALKQLNDVQARLDITENETTILALEQEETNLKEQISRLEEQILEEKKRLGNAYTDPHSVLSVLEDLMKNNFAEKNDSEFKRIIAEQFFADYDSVSIAFENDRNYEDLDAVNNAIKVLKNLKRIFIQRKELLADKDFNNPDFIEQINDALKDLEEIKKIVEKRRDDRLRKESIQYKNYVANIFSSIGISARTLETDEEHPVFKEIKSKIGPDNLAKILSKAKEWLDEKKAANEKLPQEEQVDIVLDEIFYITIVEQVRALDADNKQAISEVITDQVLTLVEKINTHPAFTKIKESHSSVLFNNLLDVLSFNPARAIKGLLQFLATPGIKGINYDQSPESSLYQFLKNQNVYALIHDLETEQRPQGISSESLKEVAELLAKIEAITNVQTLIDSNFSFTTHIKKELQLAEAAKAKQEKDEPYTPVPSLIQRRAVYDIMKFLYRSDKKDTKSRFHNWLYLKGPAGSGKTNVVIRWVLSLIPTYTPAALYTVGHNEHSATGIKESIGGVNNPTTPQSFIKDLRENTFPEGVRIVVFDEIGGVSSQTLDEVATEVHEYIKRRRQTDPDYTLDIITMGDPNQITLDYQSAPMETAVTTTDEGENDVNLLRHIQYVVNATALVSTFRSDNSAIINIQNSFIDKNTFVTTQIGRLNVNPSEVDTTDNILSGSFVEEKGAGLLIKILANSHRNDKRKKLVIVNDDDAKQRYENKIKQVIGEEALTSKAIEVVTYVEAQGRTVPEVYVDLTYDSKLFRTIKDFNAALYTATSRTVNFLYLGNVEDTSNALDVTIDQKVDTNKKQKEQLILDRINSLQEQIKILEDLQITTLTPTDTTEKEDSEITDESNTKTQDPATSPIIPEINIDDDVAGEGSSPSPLIPNTEDVSKEQEEGEAPSTKEGIVDDEAHGIDAVETTVETPKDYEEDVQSIDETPRQPSGYTHSLYEPQSNIFRPVYVGENMIFEGLNSLIEKAKEGKVPLEIFRVQTIGSEQRPNIIVAYKIDDNKVAVLGVLTETELSNAGLPNVEAILNTDVATYNEITKGILEVKTPKNTVKASLGANSHNLKYRYNSAKSTSIHIPTILNNWLKSFFPSYTRGDQVVYQVGIAEDSIQDVQNNLEIKVFNQRDMELFEGEFFGVSREDQPDTGVPYLIIKGWRRKTVTKDKTSTSPGKPQLIRLSARKLNKNLHQEFLGPIEQYIKAIKTLHSMMEKAGVKDIKLGHKDFGRIVSKLSNLWAYKNLNKDLGKNTVLNTSDRNYGTVFKLFGENLLDNNNLLEAARIVDELVHGVWLDRLAPGSRRLHKGEAQRAFDHIARANLYASTPKGLLVIRDTRPVHFSKRAGKGVKSAYSYTFTGRDLLGITSDKEVKTTFDDPIVEHQNLYIERTKARFAKKGKQFNFPTAESKIIGDNEQIVLSIEQLESIFINQFDANGDATHKNGFGLRVPIIRSRFNKRKINANQKNSYDKEIEVNLSDYFTSEFEEVIPTKISIEFSDAPAKPKPEPKPASPETKEDSDIDDIEISDEDLNIYSLSQEAVKEEGIDLGKELSLEELNALHSQYFPDTFVRAAYRWLLRKLGKSKEEQDFIKIMNGIDLERMAGRPVWGLFKAGVIYLTRVNNGSYEKILAHEVFHKVLHSYLTSEERAWVYHLIQKQWSETIGMSHRDLEEFGANKFMQWQGGKVTILGKLKNLFHKILKFLGFVKNYSNDIEDFFNKIHTGYFGGAPLYETEVTLPLDKLTKYFYGDPQLFLHAKQTFLNWLNRSYNNDDVPYTFDEAVHKTFDLLKAVVRKYDKIRAGTVLPNNTVIPGRELTEQEAILYKAARVLTESPQAFTEMTKYIFPNVKIEEFFNFDNADEKWETLNLAKEIEEKELVSPTESIIKQVKQILSTIRNEANQFVPFNQAFVMLLHNLDVIDTNQDAKDLKEWINKAFANHSGFANGEAVRRKIIEIIDGMFPDPNKQEVELPHVHFKGDGTILVDASATKNTRFLPLEEANRDSNLFIVDKLPSGEYQHEFIDRATRTINDIMRTINPNAKPITKKELTTQYKIFRNRNTWAAIITSIRSLREKNPYVGTWEHSSSGEGKIYKYFKGREAGVSAVYVSNVINSLIEYWYNNGGRLGGTTELEEKAFYNLFPQKASKSLKKTRIELFLKKVLGDKDFKVNIPDNFKDPETGKDLITALYNDLYNLLQRIKALDPEGDVAVEDLMAGERSLAQKLGKFLSAQDKMLSPVNYIRGDGKTAYTRIQSSFAMEVQKMLTKARGFLVKSLPKYFETEFYKNNIFVSGLNNIVKSVDHDSLKYSNLDQSAILYKNEIPIQWLTRVFNAGFIGHLASASREAKTYIQYVWTISNKPNIVGAEVGILDETKIRKAIEQMIRQEMTRPKLDNIKGYNRTKSHIIGLDTIVQTEAEIGGAVDKVLAAMKARAELLAKTMVNENLSMSAEMSKVAKVLGVDYDSVIDKEVASYEYEQTELSEHDFANMTEEQRQEYEENLKKELKELREHLKQDPEFRYKQILPIVEVFYNNFYVNSHQLNQLLVGDQAFFKDSYTVIKRMSIAFGPGRRGWIHDKLAMPAKSRVMVMEDLTAFVEDIKGNPKELLGEAYEPTDGQGYILPSYWEKMKLSFGVESELDVTLKPVYYAIDDQGVPRALKYSLIVLTDEMVKEFPGLGKLRELMENTTDSEGRPVEMAVFTSAMKVGNPKNLTKLYKYENGKRVLDESGNPIPLNDMEVPDAVEPESIFEIDNEHLRIQLNPAHESIGWVTNPSQLTYFPITNRLNIPAHNKLLTLNAELIRVGNRLIDRIYRLRNGKPTGVKAATTKREIRKRALRVWNEISGSENEWGLAANKEIDINLPIMINKLISILSSDFSRKGVDIKIKGSKMVLQSEFGTYLLRDKKLTWKDSENLTHVYISEDLALELGVNVGQVINKNDPRFKSIGYRLPSTGLHSAIGIRVKGIYPSPTGTKGNVVVAPQRIVWIQGSDYDIDSLFMLLMSTAKDLATDKGGGNRSLSLSNILLEISSDYNPDLTFDSDVALNYDNKKNKLLVDELGFPKEDGNTLQEFLAMTLDRVQQKIAENLSIDHQEVDFSTRRELQRLLLIEEQLITIYQTSIKNEIVETFLEILTDEANVNLMELPITMARIKAASKKDIAPSMLDVVAEMRGVKKEDYAKWEDYLEARERVLYPPVDLADPLDQRLIHYNTFSGNVLTGASANSVKVIAYTFMSTKTLGWMNKKDHAVWKKEGYPEDKTPRIYTIEEVKEAGQGSVRRGLDFFATEEGGNLDLIDVVKDIPRVDEADGIRLNSYTFVEMSDKEKKVVAKETDEGVKFELEDNKLVVGKTPDGKSIVKTYLIWETLDSLINAAIDNVKEQLLYILNLTDETANEMFAMISLGIPLDTVVKFISQPIIHALSSRGTLTTTKLKELADVILENALLNSLDSSIPKEQVDEHLQKLKEEIVTNPIEITDGLMEEIAKKYYRDPSYLFNMSLEDARLQYSVMQQFVRANNIGKSIFNASQDLQIVRKMPSTYADSKSVLEDIFKNIGNFGDYKDVTTDEDVIKEEIKETDEYKEAEDKAEYLRQEVKKRYNKESARLKAIRTKYNRLMNRTHSGYVSSSKGWIFKNSTLLSIPNFKESVLTLWKLVTLIEKIFHKHSDSMAGNARRLIQDLHMVARGNNTEFHMMEGVKDSLMTMLFTSLRLNFNNVELSLEIPNITVDLGKYTLRGLSAWTHQLANRITAAKKHLANNNESNEFLKYLEVIWDKTNKENVLSFTTDKLSDPIDQQRFKKEFLALNSPSLRTLENEEANVEFTQLQLDLFKYLIISRGLGFGRTSYSTLIPDVMYQEFSDRMVELMNRTLDNPSDNRVSAFLSNLYDQFLIQFVTNNHRVINKVADKRLIRTEDRLGGQARVDIDGRTVNVIYNLAASYKTAAPKVVKYRSGLFGLIHFDKQNETAYYRKIANTKRNKYYNLTEKVLERGFEWKKVINQNPILPTIGLIDTLLYSTGKDFETPTVKYSPGQRIYLRDSNDIGMLNMREFEVIETFEKTGDKGKYYEYRLIYIGDVNTNKDIPSSQESSNSVQAQKLIDQKEQISKRSLEDILTRLFERFGIAYETYFNRNDLRGGYFTNNKVYINLAHASRNTAFHEFAHPLIRTIKIHNPRLFNSLAAELKSNYPETLKKVKKAYPELNEEGQIEEAIVQMLGQLAGNPKSLSIATRLKIMLKSLWDYVKYFIAEAFGFDTAVDPSKIPMDATLFDMAVILKGNRAVITDSQSVTGVLDERLNSSIEDTLEALKKAAQEQGNPAVLKRGTIDKIKKIVEDASIYLDEQKQKYIDINSNEYDRLTMMAKEEFTIRFNEDATGPFENEENKLEKTLALRDFKRLGKSTTDIIHDPATKKDYTFDDRVQHYITEFNTARAWGRFVHGHIHLLLEQDPEKRKEIIKDLVEEAKEKKDANGRTIQNQLNNKSLQYLEKKLTSILAKVGIKVNTKGNEIYSSEEVDIIEPEFILHSNLLNVGTRIDGLVEHPDGTLSIVDWKTGRLLSDLFSNRVMKFGANYAIADNKLNRAKLEIAFRAVMLKEHLGDDAKFRKLSVGYLNSKDGVKVYDIDLAQFIPLIEDWFQNTYPDKYEEAKKKGLFDAQSYLGTSKLLSDYEAKLSNKDLRTKKGYILNRMAALKARYSDVELKTLPWVSKEMSELSSILINLENVDASDINNSEDDISWMESKFYNLKDIARKPIRAFSKMFFERRDKSRERTAAIFKKHDDLLKEVFVEYLEGRGLMGLLSKVTGNKVNWLPLLGGVNTNEFFAFMWRKHADENLNGYHANLLDTYQDPKTGQEIPLTDAQKAYRDFYMKTINAEYKKLVTTASVDERGKATTKGKLQELPSSLYEGFMPRIPITSTEVYERYSGLEVSKKMLEHIAKNKLSSFIEDNFFIANNKGVPLRYYSTADSEIVISENHSLNAEKGFKQFVQGIISKQEMDDVYVFGQGLLAYYNSAQDELGGKKYKYLQEFLEDHIILHILQGSPDGKIASKNWDITISPDLANSPVGKALGLKAGVAVSVNTWKLSLQLKYFTTMVGMAIKPIPAAFNGALIIMLNTLKATSNSLAMRLGVPPEDLDFTLSDLVSANWEWVKHTANWMQGKKTDTKMWKLAQQLDYLTDNYDYRVRNDESVFVKNELFGQGKLFWFHTIFENYGAMVMMTAQLKKQKIRDKDGEMKSMWDLYELNETTDRYEYKGPDRGIIKNNDGSTTVLRELTSQEINHMKRVYENIHGSYRQEERIAAELSVWGQWLLQFKKYLPVLFKQNWRAAHEDYSTGAFKLKLDENGKPIQEEGMNVYEWEARLNQGRINLILHWLFYMLPGTFQKGYTTDKYAWKNMSSEQKKQFIEFWQFVGVMFVIPFLFIEPALDDDDENKYWARRIFKLFEDASQGVDPRDLIRPVANTPFVVLGKGIQLMDGFVEFITEGMWGQRDKYGWRKGSYTLMRNLPIGSSIHQWNSFVKELEEGEQLFYQR